MKIWDSRQIQLMQITGKNYLEHVAGRVGHESGRGQKKSGLDFNVVFGPLRQKNLNWTKLKQKKGCLVHQANNFFGELQSAGGIFICLKILVIGD